MVAHVREWMLTISLVASWSVVASPYDPLIDVTARKHGINPILLRAVAQHESRKNPWTFNADGEPFQYQDKDTAVRVLWSLTKAPWMVKSIARGGKRSRRFFPSESSALAYASSAARANSLSLRTDEAKALSPGQIRVRQLRLINTDIGMAQVNYRWNGQGVATVQTWFDPAYNLNFAAARLASLRKRYGNDLTAAGYYHSPGNPTARAAYLGYLTPKYNEEKRLASVSMASSR